MTYAPPRAVQRFSAERDGDENGRHQQVRPQSVGGDSGRVAAKWDAHTERGEDQDEWRSAEQQEGERRAREC